MNESQTLKQKLIISSLLNNDQSIKTKLNENCIDLKKWCYDNEIIKFLSDENCAKLTIDIKYNPNEIAKKLSDSKSCDEFKKICDEADIYISKKEIQLLNKNFDANKQQVFDRIHDDLVLGNRKFLKIKREADRRFNDESVWYLYVSAYFLTGKSINGEIIRAPLILFKVSISNINGELNIIKKEKNIVVNEKLNLFLKQQYDIDINVKEHLELKDINKLVEYLKPITNNLNIDLLKNQKICDFSELAVPDDKFIIEPSVVYNLADPCGGIVLMDYENIIKSKIDPFEEISVISHASIYENEIIDKDNLVMFNRPLNIFQKYAVKSALNESSLIKGPPGTGKSEVIATIIANIINNNKTILMVSEKKAALDVLEERLQAIGDVCLFAYNTHDEKYFYHKIKKIHDLLNEDNELIPIPNTSNVYDKVKAIYKELNAISNIKINDKSIDEINYINVEKRKYNKKLFTLFLNISKVNKENNLNIIYHQYNHLFKLLNENLDYFNDPINLDELKTLIELANNSKFSSLIYKNYFLNHKLHKHPFMMKKMKFHTLTNEHCEQLIELVNKLITAKINQLTKEQIILFNKIKSNEINKIQDEFDSYILDQNLNQYDYKSKALLDTIYKHYVINQKRVVKDVDEIIRNNYIYQLKNWIKELECSNDEQTKNDLKELFRIASLRIAKPINQTIKKYYKILRKLFPIWILNPIQTSQVAPCEPAIFDYGIFDEASQMFYENSYPLVFRVKKSIVCGDDKQLSPIGNFVTKFFDDSYVEETDSESNIVSLFEKASTLSWPNYQLKNHYRSSSYDLISFANKYVYNDEMKVITKNGFFYRSVITYNVDGILEQDVNLIEIEKVIEVINNKFKDPNYNSNILVIAFNNKQMEALESTFNQKLNSLDTKVQEAYRNKNLMFGSIENIQGLEADDVIISLTFAKNSQGILATDFKPISEEGGINRLNVAITRAKNEMIIIKSIYANEPIISSNTELNVFIKFVEWCDKINKKQTINDIIKTQNKIDIEEMSDFQKQVYLVLDNLIDKKKYKILTKLDVGTSCLDLCVINIQTQKVQLGILCDDNSYKNTLKKMIENLDTQKLLEDRGYNIYRITLIDWKVKNGSVIEDIKNYIN